MYEGFLHVYVGSWPRLAGMRLRMMLNWHSAKSISKQSSGDPARRRMQMQVIVVLIRRPSTGSNENTHQAAGPSVKKARFRSVEP